MGRFEKRIRVYVFYAGRVDRVVSVEEASVMLAKPQILRLRGFAASLRMTLCLLGKGFTLAEESFPSSVQAFAQDDTSFSGYVFWFG